MYVAVIMVVGSFPHPRLMSEPRNAESTMAPKFAHRTNSDGTIASICSRCDVPIGNAHWEADLERMEADHICDPVRLAFFEESRRRGAKQPLGIESPQKVEPIKRVH